MMLAPSTAPEALPAKRAVTPQICGDGVLIRGQDILGCNRSNTINRRRTYTGILDTTLNA